MDHRAKCEWKNNNDNKQLEKKAEHLKLIQHCKSTRLNKKFLKRKKKSIRPNSIEETIFKRLFQGNK